MNRTTILTVVLWCVTLYIPLSCAQQSTDFQMDGTVLVKYHGSAAKVTIPKGVTAIGERAFYGCKSLTSITIPSSVTSIGSGAFSNCSSLTSITIPSSVTSIGGGVFIGYISLTSITIPASVTAIGSYAFHGCSSLSSITVDNQNPAYTSVDGVLCNKDITYLITYPAGKQESAYTIPASVTAIGDGAFDSCRSLASIIIPASVTIIGDYAFSGCESLASVTVSRKTTIGESVWARAHVFPDGVPITYSD